MDISEAVFISSFFLPLAASWIVIRVVQRIRVRWLRLSLKMLSSVLLLASGAVVFLVTLTSVGCSKSADPLYSPDRRHVAVLRYALQGALGDDYATVNVRASWRPWATTVYRGLGAWDFKADKPLTPEVRWLDSAHLLIRYWDDRSSNKGRGGPAQCVSQAGTVRVVCEAARR
jgi:hypothetical protein